MNSHQLKRQLRKELLLLRAQAYRTEIRQQADALLQCVQPAVAAGHWTDHPLLALLTQGRGRLATWIRWGLRLARWLPLLQLLSGRKDKG